MEQALDDKRQEIERIRADLDAAISDAGRKLDELEGASFSAAGLIQRLDAATTSAHEMKDRLDATVLQAKSKLDNLNNALSKAEALQRDLSKITFYLKTTLAVLGLLVSLAILPRALWAAAGLVVLSRGLHSHMLRSPENRNSQVRVPESSSSGAWSHALSPGKFLVLMPGWVGAVDRSAVQWRPRCVGGVWQWIRRGVAFLDVFWPSSKDSSEAQVLISGPCVGRVVDIDLQRGERLRVRPRAFVGAEVETPTQIRYRSCWLPWTELFLEGRRRWFFVEGPAKVYVYLPLSGVSVELPPDGSFDVVPEFLIAAPPDSDGLSETLVGLSIVHWLTGRGAYTKRLTNIGDRDVRIYLAAPVPGSEAVVVQKQHENLVGVVVDLATAVPLR